MVEFFRGITLADWFNLMVVLQLLDTGFVTALMKLLD